MDQPKDGENDTLDEERPLTQESPEMDQDRPLSDYEEDDIPLTANITEPELKGESGRHSPIRAPPPSPPVPSTSLQYIAATSRPVERQNLTIKNSEQGKTVVAAPGSTPSFKAPSNYIIPPQIPGQSSIPKLKIPKLPRPPDSLHNTPVKRLAESRSSSTMSLDSHSSSQRGAAGHFRQNAASCYRTPLPPVRASHLHDRGVLSMQNALDGKERVSLQMFAKFYGPEIQNGSTTLFMEGTGLGVRIGGDNSHIQGTGWRGLVVSIIDHQTGTPMAGSQFYRKSTNVYNSLAAYLIKNPKWPPNRRFPGLAYGRFRPVDIGFIHSDLPDSSRTQEHDFLFMVSGDDLHNGEFPDISIALVLDWLDPDQWLWVKKTIQSRFRRTNMVCKMVTEYGAPYLLVYGGHQKVLRHRWLYTPINDGFTFQISNCYLNSFETYTSHVTRLCEPSICDDGRYIYLIGGYFRNNIGQLRPCSDVTRIDVFPSDEMVSRHDIESEVPLGWHTMFGAAACRIGNSIFVIGGARNAREDEGGRLYFMRQVLQLIFNDNDGQLTFTARIIDFEANNAMMDAPLARSNLLRFGHSLHVSLIPGTDIYQITVYGGTAKDDIRVEAEDNVYRTRDRVVPRASTFECEALNCAATHKHRDADSCVALYLRTDTNKLSPDVILLQAFIGQGRDHNVFAEGMRLFNPARQDQVSAMAIFFHRLRTNTFQTHISPELQNINVNHEQIYDFLRWRIITDIFTAGQGPAPQAAVAVNPPPVAQVAPAVGNEAAANDNQQDNPPEPPIMGPPQMNPPEP